MTRGQFEREFKKRGGVFLSEDILLLRKPLELYSLTAKRVLAKLDDLSEVYPIKLNGQTIASLIDGWEHIPILMIRGGRGGSSGFDYSARWPSAAGGGTDHTTSDLPARLNVKIGVNRTYDDALQAFIQTHAGDDYESGATFDEQGYTTRYVHGNSGSVAISGGSGEMVVHNHPAAGWPNFSKEDLLSTAAGSESGIVAVSSRQGRSNDTAKYAGTYSFTKGTHFNASGFIKAINNAQISGKDYNDAVSRWLKNNQKKFDYRYTYKKA